MHLTPHIVVRGAAEAAAFYERAFGAQERSRVLVPATDGRRLTAVDRRHRPQINTDDVDALWERAVAAGAEVLHPLTDPYGHKWGLAQRVREVPHDEIVAAAAAMFGAGA